MSNLAMPRLPAWVPKEVVRYLRHTNLGVSIRKLAKEAEVHPSTVMRQVRRIEERREDLLVDGALKSLTLRYSTRVYIEDDGSLRLGAPSKHDCFDEDALRSLTVLAQPGALLGAGPGMEKAVILRQLDGGSRSENDRVVVDLFLAQSLALRDWIGLSRGGRVSQYKITPDGRAALAELTAAREQAARHREESLTKSGLAGFIGAARGDTETSISKRTRYGLQETPVQMLGRLNNRHGQPFLSREMVLAGERLREDYELAQIGAQFQADFDEGCIGEAREHKEKAAKQGSTIGDTKGSDISCAANRRVAVALSALGPGLSDIAMRCCCQLEGLEAAERALGWSARSGKIVLRIALQQLEQHYAEQPADISLIG